MVSTFSKVGLHCKSSIVFQRWACTANHRFFTQHARNVGHKTGKELGAVSPDTVFAGQDLYTLYAASFARGSLHMQLY